MMTKINEAQSIRKARVFAFYLPQFHPIKENDEWWGKGFTEWTNVGKAKPLFKGHYQPRVPADLGYYDLRLPEVREAQAELARNAGIESFMYWHYWFGNGRRILERPFNEVLKSGKPDFPFCLGWANHSWSNHTWISDKQWDMKVLIEQTYPGVKDYESHFYAILDAFHDKRYTRIDNKPVFLVYNPLGIPNPKIFTDLWNELAIQNGFAGIHFIGHCAKVKDYSTILNNGFNAINSMGHSNSQEILKGKFQYITQKRINRFFGGILLQRTEYKDIIKYFYTEEDKWLNVYPSIIPQYDRSARGGKYAEIFTNSTPELFKEHVKNALDIISEKPYEHKLIFLRSWNEWAEGNYIEPDLKYRTQYLDVLKQLIW